MPAEALPRGTEGLQLPWHVAVWESLEQRVAGERLHHAVLFCGPAGTGKRRLARRLALRLLCLTPAAGEACGTCRSCELMRAGTHPDCLTVCPEEAGRQIRIAQVREGLVEFVTRTASISTAKVVLIEPAEAMNVHTANCLLKSLEEPAPRTHLLLVSDAPVRLLPTIRSRCEMVRLGAPAWDAALEWLRDQGVDQQGAELLGVASGCPLRALELGAGGGLERYDRIAAVMLRALRPQAWVSGLARDIEDIELLEVLRWMQVFLVALSRWQVEPGGAPTGRSTELFAELAPRVAQRHVARCLRSVVSAYRDAGGTSNPSRQLMIESLLIEWANLGTQGGDAPLN